MKVALNEHGQRKVAKYYAKSIGPLRAKAKTMGYALGVHGSIKRDIDLIACPWTDEAMSAQELAEALLAVANEVLGFAVYGCDGPFPLQKPHGRLCWTIHHGCTYIDLSVMPRHE